MNVDLSNYYNKSESDSRYKSINYVPNWSEISGKPTTFTPSAHTHTISEVTNLQTTLDNKVDKVTGKQLSTEDYTTAEKSKLAGLSNYNDNEVRELISALNLRLTTLEGDYEALEARVAALETPAA